MRCKINNIVYMNKVLRKIFQVKLSKVFRKLDTVAAISNKSLLAVVTETIDITKNMKFHCEKNKLVRQKTDLTTEM